MQSLVEAINSLLTQAQFLRLAYIADHGADLIGGPIPQLLSEPPRAMEDGKITYNASGLTDPREDGAVRVKAFDDAVAVAAKGDAVEQAWAAQREQAPWLMIHEVASLPGLTERQRHTIVCNCSNATLLNGLLAGGTRRGLSWFAYHLRPTLGNPGLDTTNAIPDAFALVTSLRAADVADFAKSSLEHFRLTSGAAVTRK